MKGVFVTATDTEVGKTFISGAIAAALRVRGHKVGVVKPVASGCFEVDDRLLSEDATFLMTAADIAENRRHEVNPVCLKPALTPAVAAIESQTIIDVEELNDAARKMMVKSDYTVVEGVGGIVAPLWQDYLVADMMLELKLPAILVTRPDLGTINHTVLTASYAKERGIMLGGIVINRWDKEKVGVLELSNAAYIERLTGLPILGRFPTMTAYRSEDFISILADMAEKHLIIDEIVGLMEGKR